VEIHKSNLVEKQPMKLTSKQIQCLRTQAHHIKAQIQIGKNGVTSQQINQIKQALEDHELIKIKFNSHKNRRETLSRQIIEKTNSEQIRLIGNTLIIFKQKQDPNKQEIDSK